MRILVQLFLSFSCQPISRHPVVRRTVRLFLSLDYQAMTCRGLVPLIGLVVCCAPHVSRYGAGALAVLWYDPQFASHPQQVATCGDGARTGREPCDGDDFGALGRGTVPCSALGPLWVGGTLDCHQCSVVTSGCTVAPLDVPTAGGIS